MEKVLLFLHSVWWIPVSISTSKPPSIYHHIHLLCPSSYSSILLPDDSFFRPPSLFVSSVYLSAPSVHSVSLSIFSLSFCLSNYLSVYLPVYLLSIFYVCTYLFIHVSCHQTTHQTTTQPIMQRNIWLTKWSIFLPQKLTVARLCKKIPECYETLLLISVLARHF